MKPEQRPDRRTRIAQGPGPGPTPAEQARDGAAAAEAHAAAESELESEPDSEHAPRKARNTVMGSAALLADAAKNAAAAKPPPPPVGKIPSGRHKTITEGNKLPAALRKVAPESNSATSEAVTELPSEPKPTMRRGSGSYQAVGGDEADNNAATAAGRTVIPGGTSDPVVTGGTVVPTTAAAPAIGKTVVPGAAPVVAAIDKTVVPGAAPAVAPVAKTVVPGAVVAAPAAALRDRRLTPATPDRSDLPSDDRTTIPVYSHPDRDATDPPVGLAASPRTGTQPIRGNADAPESSPAGGRAASRTRPHGNDADRRRATQMHGVQGLVDAGNEAPKLRLTPGKVIPGTRYKILRWLGEGGMGVVYEAAHVDIERRSALKILRFDLSRQPKMVQVFRDEARAASRLGSPHIVEIYDFGELPDGRLFFAMELLDGHDLVPTEDDPVLEPGRLIGILRQVCKGLAAAHDAGVVHRDVKPENVIIADVDGRRDVAKIVDFGISSMLAAGQGDGAGFAGTPHYMAPEQILGDSFDGRLDVYALGATAYELLAGQPPFDADEVEDILQLQVSGVPTAPRTLRPDLKIPAALESVILRCLAKRPEQRYPNMAELEAALCEAQIAANLTTPWDDLAIPDIADADRRAEIVQRMPNATVDVPHKRSLVWPIVAGASTLAAIGLGAFLAFGIAPPTEAELDIVEQISAQARDAAADQIWVVPLPTRPDAPTAYMKVLELEDVTGPAEDAADERGAELRERFAESLVSRADEWWENGVQKIAYQHYLYAITFDRDNARARERLKGMEMIIADFIGSAESGKFSAMQTSMAMLTAAESEEDPQARQAMRDQGLEAAGDLQHLIADAPATDLAGDKSRPAGKRGAGVGPTDKGPEERAVPPPIADPAAAEPVVDPDEDLVIDPVADDPKKDKSKKQKRRTEQEAGALLGKAERDPQKAEALADEGKAALSAGQRQKAASLFNQAIAFDRRNSAALMGLSDIYFDTGANQKAVNYAEKAVDASPNTGRYRIKLGDAYFKVLRYKDAKEQYEKAKNLGASNADQRLQKVDAKLGG